MKLLLSRIHLQLGAAVTLAWLAACGTPRVLYTPPPGKTWDDLIATIRANLVGIPSPVFCPDVAQLDSEFHAQLSPELSISPFSQARGAIAGGAPYLSSSLEFTLTNNGTGSQTVTEFRFGEVRPRSTCVNLCECDFLELPILSSMQVQVEELPSSTPVVLPAVLGPGQQWRIVATWMPPLHLLGGRIHAVDPTGATRAYAKFRIY